jgi:hypothetical protein
MANHTAIEFQVLVYGDGVSTTQVIDLLNDPVTSEAGSIFINKFSLNHLVPTSVVMLGGVTASLSGTSLTITFPTAPTGATTATGYFLF